MGFVETGCSHAQKRETHTRCYNPTAYYIRCWFRKRQSERRYSDLNLGIRSKVVVDALRHTGEISSTKAISVRRPPASERGQVGRFHPLNGKASGRSRGSGPDRQCYGPGCRSEAQHGQRSQRRFDSAIPVNSARLRSGMASCVDTATRHKREQRCYSFMHIYIYLLLLLSGQGERLFDWWALLNLSPET